ncbi:hypothetical protein DFH11DRAFT_1691282 [Phellopilus nigrolimitatus]|nr:hypothetical protein DFH11DRAFT_1691282 [Phellopilus nigrolimitatus]
MLSSRSAIQPIDPNDVPFLVSQIDLLIYCQIAVATVLVYDTIITMDKEVKYFWRSSRSLVSLIYFLNRYIGLFSAFVKLRHKKLAICLRSMFAMEAAFTLGILVYIILLYKVVVELLLMVLALYRAADYWRTSAGLRGCTLVKVVVQDQALYFIFIGKITGFSFSSTVSIIFSKTVGSATLLCILGSRMMFRLKEAVNDGTSFKEGTMSNMVFASCPPNRVVSE